GAGSGPTVRPAELRHVTVLDLVRAAGLHPCPVPALQDAVLLLPGYHVADIVRRGLDLGLEVTYRPVGLRPLFQADSAGRAAYEIRLHAGGQRTVPASLLAALDRDPFILVCRRPADGLLVRHGFASPLPDRALATLAGDEGATPPAPEPDPTHGTLVFADASHGCARLHPLRDPHAP